MQIFIDGNTVKAARITGPEHHFLCVDFSGTEGEIVFVDNSEGSTEKLNERKSLLEKVISELQCDLVKSIRMVSFDTRDTPNESAYKELFIGVVSKAESYLESK